MNAVTERYLDVRGLEPPEPLERALDALSGMPRGEYLRMCHHREPHLLYPMLVRDGFEFRSRARPDRFDVVIWHRGDHITQRAALQALSADA